MSKEKKIKKLTRRKDSGRGGMTRTELGFAGAQSRE
jgi:hypothetical protein